MRQIKTFLIISFSFFSLAIAQSTNIGLSASETRIDQQSSKISLQMQINIPVENGFYIDVPAGVKMVPSSINLSGLELWLKKSNEIPTNSKVAHWNYDNDKIIFLFADGILDPGAGLSILFQSHSPNDQTESSSLTMRSLQGNTPQNFQAGEVQSRVQLVQTEK